MAATKIDPYTLIEFGAIPDATVFVGAGEYAGTQDELALGLNWRAAYQNVIDRYINLTRLFEIVSVSPTSIAQEVKYEDCGYYLNGLGATRHQPDDTVITGPDLSSFPKIGGPLGRNEKQIIHHLEGLMFHRANRSELYKQFGRRPIQDTLKFLEQARLIELSNDRAYLSNLGFLRCLQDRT